MKQFVWNLGHRPRAPRIVLWIGVAACLAGCSTPRKIDPAFVADRWSTTLSAFNIDPIFLPRQVHLGDIYLAGETSDDPNSDTNRWKRRTLYLGRADVRDAILADTTTRLRLPGTSVVNPSDNVFEAPATTTALRPVAFPGFNVSEIRETDFAAAFPVKLFRALFGGSRSGELVMSMSVPSAEYEEVPGLIAWKKFGEFCWKKGEDPVCAASNPVLQHLFNSLKMPNDKTRIVPRVGIVTSVYYARQIDYFYNTGRASAFGASASQPAPAQQPPATSPEPAAGNSAKSTTAAATASAGPATTPPAGAGNEAAADGKDKGGADAQTAALHAQVEALQKRLDELQTKSDGAEKFGSIRVVSSTKEGTVLSQKFERPVAIGYRAIWIYPLGYDPSAPIVTRKEN